MGEKVKKEGRRRQNLEKEQKKIMTKKMLKNTSVFASFFACPGIGRAWPWPKCQNTRVFATLTVKTAKTRVFYL